MSASRVTPKATTTRSILSSERTIRSMPTPPNNGRGRPALSTSSRNPTGFNPYSGCSSSVAAILALTSPAPTNRVRSANQPRVRMRRTSQYWAHRVMTIPAATMPPVTINRSVEAPGTLASAKPRNGAQAQAAIEPASRATLRVIRGR